MGRFLWRGRKPGGRVALVPEIIFYSDKSHNERPRKSRDEVDGEVFVYGVGGEGGGDTIGGEQCSLNVCSS